MLRHTLFILTLAAVAAVGATTTASAQYCGGEEDSLLEDAHYYLSDEEYEEARELLVAALQDGEVASWERADALMLLAETQLRMGDHRPAVINYRRAMEVDAEGVGEGARVGLALALRGIRRNAEAHAEASRFIEDAGCAHVSDFTAGSCYGAYLVQSVSAPDEEARLEAGRSAEQLRSDQPGYEDRYHELRTLARNATRPQTAAAIEAG